VEETGPWQEDRGGGPFRRDGHDLESGGVGRSRARSRVRNSSDVLGGTAEQRNGLKQGGGEGINVGV